MKIYYDENMPFVDKFFSDLGDLFPFSGRNLTAKQIADADVLLVRSITQVNEELLCKNKKLAFVGTATIGIDHIDQNYLAGRNIPFYCAHGCNAISVAEYVLSALVVMAERYLLNLSSLTIGIIGAGNTGTQFSKKCDALGIKYLLCDPLLEKTIDKRNFASLEQTLKCDVISLHVPLTRQGECPTYHLIDESCLKDLRDDQILINACRGEVVDNQALLKIKQQGHGVKLILDVWENEPNVLIPLIEFADIATAHIAGYSLEGKARGTEMLYQALCKQLKIKPTLNLAQFLPTATINYVEIKQDFDEIILNQLVKMVYDVRRDDAIFRQQLICQGFDMIRKTYPTRREFSAISVSLQNTAKCDVPHRLGFNR
ncbi:MAG: 4-phosphoerythronate dehydrogenase [Alteromonadaceae bacterium]|nr:4-phosphoerythronate dehydrogenase [Alteromonadaceae bacterium]